MVDHADQCPICFDENEEFSEFCDLCRGHRTVPAERLTAFWLMLPEPEPPVTSNYYDHMIDVLNDAFPVDAHQRYQRRCRLINERYTDGTKS